MIIACSILLLLLLILPSVFFRVNPWQMLLHLLSSVSLLLLILLSVSLLLSFSCFSVLIRGYASSWLSFRG
jgi:hypothetical protein